MKARFAALVVLLVVASACGGGVDSGQGMSGSRGAASASEVQAVASATARIANNFAAFRGLHGDVAVIVAAFDNVKPLSELLGGVVATEVGAGLKFSNATGAVRCAEWVGDSGVRASLTDCDQQVVYFGAGDVLQREPGDGPLTADELGVLAAAVAGLANAYTDACLSGAVGAQASDGSPCVALVLDTLGRAVFDLETLAWMLGYENDTSTGPVELETGVKFTNGAGVSVCVEILSVVDDRLSGAAPADLKAQLMVAPTDCAGVTPRIR